MNKSYWVLGGVAVIIVLALAGMGTTIIRHKQAALAVKSQTLTNISLTTVPDRVQLAVQEISHMYGEKAPHIAEVTRMISGKQAGAFEFHLKGAFRKGNSGQDAAIRASSLIITIPNNVPNKSQTYISTAAYNTEGKQMWTETNGIFNNDNVGFSGKSSEWRVAYRIIGSRMMVSKEGQVMADSDEHSFYHIQYTLPDAKAVGDINFSFTADGKPVFSSRTELPPSGILDSSAGNSAGSAYWYLPNSVALTIHWSGHVETIQLSPVK